MSIARIVDHLYQLRKEDDRITIHFSTNRLGWFIPIFIVFGLCFFVVRIAVHLGWNDTLIGGIVGGAISMVAGTCFAVVEHITRYVITIESDVVYFQRTFEGVPVGAKTIYSRPLLRDFGVYPHENRSRHGGPFKSGRLCLWCGSRSIEIESFLPISECVSLAKDLREMGVEFPRTFRTYEEYLASGGRYDYLSF